MSHGGQRFQDFNYYQQQQLNVGGSGSSVNYRSSGLDNAVQNNCPGFHNYTQSCDDTTSPFGQIGFSKQHQASPACQQNFQRRNLTSTSSSSVPNSTPSWVAREERYTQLPFSRPRRISYLERLRLKRENKEIGIGYDDSPKERKTSEDEKLLMQNVKDMLRQGFSLSEVTKVTTQLLGDSDQMDTCGAPPRRLSRMSSQMSSMEVDGNESSFPNRVSRARNGKPLRQRKSFHVNMNNTDKVVKTCRRTNSFEFPSHDYDSYSHCTSTNSTNNSRIEPSQPSFLMRSTSFNGISGSNLIEIDTAAANGFQNSPLSNVSHTQHSAVNIHNSGFSNTSTNFQVSRTTGSSLPAMNPTPTHSLNVSASENGATSSLLKRHLSYIDTNNSYGKSSVSDYSIDYEKILFGPEVKKTRL